MKLGFTGTQIGMTDLQLDAVRDILREKSGEFHHGDCIGADAQAHEAAESAGFAIHIHPPVNPSKRAFKVAHISRMKPKLPYLDRNKNIVLATESLLAAPGEMEEQLRSGTWSTIRFAKKHMRPILIVYPDGSLHHC